LFKACPRGQEGIYSCYFAGAAAGVDGVADALLTAFLFFFTCFFAAGAVLVAGVAAGAEAGAWAASDNPAVAKIRERPRTADVIVFILRVLFEALSCQPLY